MPTAGKFIKQTNNLHTYIHIHYSTCVCVLSAPRSCVFYTYELCQIPSKRSSFGLAKCLAVMFKVQSERLLCWIPLQETVAAQPVVTVDYRSHCLAVAVTLQSGHVCGWQRLLTCCRAIWPIEAAKRQPTVTVARPSSLSLSLTSDRRIQPCHVHASLHRAPFRPTVATYVVNICPQMAMAMDVAL